MNKQTRRYHQASRLRRKQEAANLEHASADRAYRAYQRGRSLAHQAHASSIPGPFIEAVMSQAARAFGSKVAEEVDGDVPRQVVYEVAKEVWKEIQKGISWSPGTAAKYYITRSFERMDYEIKIMLNLETAQRIEEHEICRMQPTQSRSPSWLG